jgi:internalin A
VTSLVLDHANIEDLSGLQMFTNLQHLSLRGNAIQVVPDLSQLTQLRSLDLGDNQIKQLKGLPTGLQSLLLDQNHLRRLTALTGLSQLRLLDFSANQVGALPALTQLTSLETLVCDNNHLASLPTLPASLRELHVSGNYLSALPAFQDAIVHLDARHNLLSDASSLASNAIGSATSTLLLDDNNLDSDFCPLIDEILKRGKGRINFTYSDQLQADGWCGSGVLSLKR